MKPLYYALTVLYGASAAWCLAWPTDNRYLLPAIVLALAAVPIAVLLFLKRQAAYVALWIQAGVFVVAALASASYAPVKALYWGALHTALAALPFAHARVRRQLFGGGPERAAQRHEIKLHTAVELEGKRRSGEMLDLSKNGAFIQVPVDGLAVGQRVFVQVYLRANKSMRLPAKIKNVSAEGRVGIGVDWTNPTPDDHENIAHYMAEGVRLAKLAQPLKLRGTFLSGGQSHTCDLYALTTNGCYIDDNAQVLQPGEKITLTIHLYDNDTVDVLAEVMWLAGDATIAQVTNVKGSALEFRGLSGEDEERIQARITVT